MSIRDYFKNILNIQGYDAWEEATEKAWSLYQEEEYAPFIRWARAENIDLTLKDEKTGYLFLTLWAWEQDE